MCDDLVGQIQEAAAEAQNLLGQLGPLAWALHVHHAGVGPDAILLSVDPEAFVKIAPPDPLGEIRKRVVGCLQALRQGVACQHAPRLFTSDGLREVINRSIVVYAAAVLEGLLDRAGEDLWMRLGGKAKRCPQCRRRDGWPADTLGKLCRLAGRPVKVELRQGCAYTGTAWLVLVRNAIIHNDGRAGDRIPGDMLNARLANCWRLDKDTQGHDVLVWDPCGTRCPDELPGKPFSIAIDHFILPRLQDAQAFVAEAAEKLTAAARQACPKQSQSH